MSAKYERYHLPPPHPLHNPIQRQMAHPGGASTGPAEGHVVRLRHGTEPFKVLFDSTCKCEEMKSLFRSTYGKKVVQSCISHSDSPIKAPYVPAHIFDPTLSLWFLNNTESAYFFMSRSSYSVSFFMETKSVM